MRAPDSLSRAEDGGQPWSGERYQALGLLGRGTFGDVYLARDHVRDQDVALKRLRHWDAAALAQLRREFRALKHIEHVNLVTLYELYADDRDGFITMEVVEGVSVVDYIRTCPDSTELRGSVQRCLAQLVQAVGTLHERGTLHRDLKPSNALVTQAGRLVVLDAGLAKSLDAQRSSDRYLCGTPAYMSPEQAVGQPLDEASDWYSFGVIAYELLTGRVPFDDHPRGLLYAKVSTDVPSIAELRPDLPVQDVHLLDALLDRDPKKRPTHATLCQWLKIAPERPAASSRPPAKTASTLIGRGEELEQLDSALAAAREQGCAVVRVVGASGMGKTALVQHWMNRLSAVEVTSLAGRCYQRETVLFSGFEDIFDAIAGLLAKKSTLHLLQPEELASIQLVFGHRLPLDAMSANSDATLRARIAPPEPLERRRLVGRAMARLLESIVADTTLVIWLDDLQWGGIETATLLSDIARARLNRGCLLIVSHRPLSNDDGRCVLTLSRSVAFTHTLELGPLHTQDSIALVERASGGTLALADIEKLVHDAAGHPLLLDQATRHCATESLEHVDLGAILAARVRALPDDARQLLRLLSIAAEPLPETTALSAASLPGNATAVRTLLAADLIRRVGRVGHCLVPFHDQLRDVVGATLEDPERAALNGAIARALEKHGHAQPESLVGYYLAAGERRRAAQYVSAAAAHMAEALAFDRAAKLFRICLDLATELGDADITRLRDGLADALVNSGRVEEGARVRLETAAKKVGPERERLVAKAASELIRAGRVDEGLQHARTTLEALGVRLARGGIQAVPSIALDRARLRVRGLRYELRSAATAPKQALERIDWCQSLAMVLPVFDTFRAFQVHSQGLLSALDAGEPARLAQSLALEAGFRMALAGGRDASGRVQQLLDTARTLANGSEEPRAQGIVEIIAGSIRWSLGDWAGCVSHVDRGVATLRRHCVGVSWEVNLGQTHALDALAWMGAMRRKREVLLEELEQARARGDLYAETMYTVRDLPTMHLVDDRIAEARGCSEALGRWPNRGFQVEHMADLYKQTEVDLYEASGVCADQRISAKWRALASSQLMRLQPFRIELRSLRGRAALAAASERRPGRARERSLALAERIWASIEREAPSVRGAVFGAPLAAGIARMRGDVSTAAQYLESGIRMASESGMHLHEQAMSRQLGELLGGDEGGERVAAADAWLFSEGLRRPDRYAQMLCPAIAAFR